MIPGPCRCCGFSPIPAGPSSAAPPPTTSPSAAPAGLRTADLSADAPLPPGKPDVGIPPLLCIPERALALLPGVWPLDPEDLSAPARIMPFETIGPTPPPPSSRAWKTPGTAAVARGGATGRADPRFSPKAVANA